MKSSTFKEMYAADISPTLISKVTEAVIEQVVEWQSRPLDSVYPIVYLDCIVVKIRQDKQMIHKAIYQELGVNFEGHKELLGLRLSENEGAKFWLGVLTELQNRGVKDILIACVDGIKDFPDAISAAFPQAQTQLCIVHKAIKKRKLFSTDDSACKVVYLAMMDASKKWTMPIRNWRAALNWFLIEFENRISDYV